MLLLEKVIAAINTQKLNRPFIIAIDGLSGSGKTTITKEICENLPNSITFHIDDYITERSKRYFTGEDQWKEYFFLQWDTSMLEKQLFQSAIQANDCILPFYLSNLDSHELRQTKVAPNSIIIIEGIFLQRTEWKNYFDFIIYVDCPREIRDERILKRSNFIGDSNERLQKYKERYWPAEDYYLEQFKPRETADFVITNF